MTVVLVVKSDKKRAFSSLNPYITSIWGFWNTGGICFRRFISKTFSFMSR